MTKYYVSTEFNEDKPAGYRLNRLLVVTGPFVRVCDPGTHTVGTKGLSAEVEDSISRLYLPITSEEFLRRFFNLAEFEAAAAILDPADG